MPAAGKITLHGGGWDTADLSIVMASMRQLHGTLKLYDMYTPSEAACCSAELATSLVTSLCHHGSQATVFPPSLVRLDIRQWHHRALRRVLGFELIPFAPRLAHLQPLLELQEMSISSFGWTLAEEDVQHLADCVPNLRELHVEMLLSPAAEITCSLKPLADLLPGVCLQLTVHLFASELHFLAEQLQAIRLATLDLRCLCGEFCEGDEALLALCAIDHLTVHFADSGTRLQHVPPGEELVHGARCKFGWESVS